MFKNKKELELSYDKFKSILTEYDTETSFILVLLANYLFELYPELHKNDILHKEIDIPFLKVPENYSELMDLYAFNTDSYVYTVLNAAHDLLLVSEQLRNKGIKVE